MVRQEEGWDEKKKKVLFSPLFGRVISTSMKHMNCIQIKNVFINIKMGGVFLFFFPSQNILTNIWHCLTESHLKCCFSDCPVQPALLWAQGLLASGSPFPANGFSGGGVEWVHTIAQLRLTKNLA